MTASRTPTAAQTRLTALENTLRLLTDAGEQLTQALGEGTPIQSDLRRIYVAVRDTHLPKLKAAAQVKPAQAPQTQSVDKPASAPPARMKTVAQPVRGAKPIPADNDLLALPIDDLVALCNEHGIRVPMGPSKSGLRRLLAQQRDAKPAQQPVKAAQTVQQQSAASKAATPPAPPAKQAAPATPPADKAATVKAAIALGTLGALASACKLVGVAADHGDGGEMAAKLNTWLTGQSQPVPVAQTVATPAPVNKPDAVCKGTRKDGQPCGSKAGDSGFCRHHDSQKPIPISSAKPTVTLTVSADKAVLLQKLAQLPTEILVELVAMTTVERAA